MISQNMKGIVRLLQETLEPRNGHCCRDNLGRSGGDGPDDQTGNPGWQQRLGAEAQPPTPDLRRGQHRLPYPPCPHSTHAISGISSSRLLSSSGISLGKKEYRSRRSSSQPPTTHVTACRTCTQSGCRATWGSAGLPRACGHHGGRCSAHPVPSIHPRLRPLAGPCSLALA